MGRKCNVCRLNDTWVDGKCVESICASNKVTVNLDDLRAVLNAVDYMTDRSLIGAVDRMSDALVLRVMQTESSR